jgi:hypothetical protein
MGVCAKTSPSGPTISFGNMSGFAISSGELLDFTVTGFAKDLAGGTYQFGICFLTSSPDWNNNNPTAALTIMVLGDGVTQLTL